jgi:hypothetical protein
VDDPPTLHHDQRTHPGGCIRSAECGVDRCAYTWRQAFAKKFLGNANAQAL